MTKDELLADARLKWGRLKKTDAAATLQRVEYARALVAVRDSRAYLSEDCEDFFSWVLRETGLKQMQANQYLDAARVPTELVDGRTFDWHALALLGRASEWPEAQRLLADGIEALGLAAARKVWHANRRAAGGEPDRFTAQLGAALAALRARRELTEPGGAPWRRGLRTVLGALTRLGPGVLAKEEDEHLFFSLRQLLDGLIIKGVRTSAEVLKEPTRGAAPTIVGDDKKPNDFRNGEVKIQDPEKPRIATERRSDKAPDWAEPRKVEGASERPRPARLDDDPAGAADEALDDSADAAAGGAGAAAGGGGGAGGPTEGAEATGPVVPEGPAGSVVTGRPADGPAALDHAAVVAALLHGDEALRPQLYNAIEGLLGDDTPEWQEHSTKVLRGLGDTAVPGDGLSPEALAAWVAQATAPDLFWRWEVLFPLLLSLDDDPGLGEVLWALHKGADLPAELRAQAGAASARHPFPPLLTGDDVDINAEPFVSARAEVESRIEALKAATARPTYR